MKYKPTFEQINSALSYDPVTGVVTRKHRHDSPPNINARYAGKIAGGQEPGRYFNLVVKVDGVKCRISHHRIAWILMTGDWPKGQIDHKDGDKGNNRWDNLRECTASQNQANKIPYGSSGLKGVSRTPKSIKWRAQIRVNGKAKHLGSFDTKEEAHAAYCLAAEVTHGDFAYHIARGDSD